MNTAGNGLDRGFSVLITILTPVVIILTVLRLMMTPVFLNVEYNLPGFPADPFGFTREERLKWSKVSLDYLLSNQNIHIFDTLTLQDGSPLYNVRELSHMDDVKRLVTSARILWLVALILFVAISLYFYIRRQEHPWYRGVRLGGYITILLIALMLLSTFTNFDWLFTEFHHLFFTGDSWLFYYSDTFIRLFPSRFWMDAFIFTGVLSLLAAWGGIHISNQRLRQG